jgi:hypothetical protein
MPRALMTLVLLLAVPAVAQPVPKKGLNPLCASLARAALDAQRDFASLRGKEVSRFAGEVTWQSTNTPDAAVPAYVHANALNKKSSWAATFMESPDKASAQKTRKQLLAIVKDCSFPGQKLMDDSAPSADLDYAVFALPNQGAMVEVIRKRLGKKHLVQLIVQPVRAKGAKTASKTPGLKAPTKGTVQTAPGESYKGALDPEGRPHGQGKITSAKEGWTLEGRFEHGKIVPGTRYKRVMGNGDSWEGPLDKGNNPTGKGVLRFAAGISLDGTFEMGFPKPGAAFVMKGPAFTYRGPIDKQSRFHGKGRLESGSDILEATFDHGEVKGEAVRRSTQNSQAVQRGPFKMNVGFVGLATTTVDPPGSAPFTIKGNFVQGQPDGVHIVRDSNGQEVTRATFRQGKLVSGNNIYTNALEGILRNYVRSRR